MRILDEHRATRLGALCELIVPGSSRVGPVVYLDALLARMAVDAQSAALGAIDALSCVDSVDALAERVHTAEFALVRALAIEAYYSDFVAAGSPGPGAWAEIGFEPPRAVDLERDWSWLGLSGNVR